MRYISFCIAMLGFLFNSYAQMRIGLFLPENRSRVTVPFEFINNLVVIPLTINNQLTLNFILDTGANTPILTERLFADILDLRFDRSMEISGPGLIDSIQAHVVTQLSLDIPNGIQGENMAMLVLEQDYIELKKNLGEELYGIIGYDIFKRFVVEINYEKSQITFTDPAAFRPSRRYTEFDLMIEQTKPYIYTQITSNNNIDTLKLMIDTGASHALLVDVRAANNLTLPRHSLETSLGHGLGGEISGRIGRFESMQIGKYDLTNILVAIPDDGAYSNAIKRGSRHGTIGGNALYHFNTIFDYHHRKFYLQRNNNFGHPFEYDMSGMRIAYFENPNRLEITGILKDSPAGESILQIGDVVKSINGRTINDTSLSSIYALLRSRNGRKVKIRIIRNDENLNCVLKLRRMI